MKTIRILLSILLLALFFSGMNPGSIQIALLKYSGGGDWYANPTSLPNLIIFCNKNLNTNIAADPVTIEVGDPNIFNFPFIHMTGHGNVIFSDAEADNLRKYLIGGGFLHIDDNYGMDKYIRPQLKKVFPELELIEVPFNHSIYRQKYTFTNGLPKVHEHDNKSPQGFGLFWEGRMVCFYTYECDLGDGWENPEVHRDPEELRTKALQMGANIIQFTFRQ